MSEIKLSYFDARGRAETLRMCMAWGGVEYEDWRMKNAEEEWPVLKPSKS